jgi:hypothetical protein
MVIGQRQVPLSGVVTSRERIIPVQRLSLEQFASFYHRRNLCRKTNIYPNRKISPNLQEVNMHKRTKKTTHLLYLIVILSMLMSGGLVKTGPFEASSAQAAVSQQEVLYPVTLSVVSARTEGEIAKGAPISEFKYLISVDNTGDPFDQAWCDPATNPDFPDGCDLPSIRTVPGWAPIYTQGDQDSASGIALPPGKYLVSVTADGFKIDGEHFTVPGDTNVEVQMHPLPLPPATMVIKIFEDNALTNGAFDAPAERGLAGFRASINDIAGEITTDLFGNPLCTEYDADGNITKLGAGCYSDANGDITIPNIGPLRYDVLIFPPAGELWIQTTTLEGSLGWDTWLQEAGTGLDNEFLIAAEPFPWTIFGFVQPTAPPADWIGAGGIKGVIMGAATYIPATNGLPYVGDTFGGFMGSKLHRPIVRPWMSLNDLGRGDVAVWVGQGNADGSFEINGVPDGNYFLAYWDEKLHYILDFVQVTVSNGQMTDVGIRMLTGWFTEVYGTVFHDLNQNGKRDGGEPGIPHYVVVLKDRDNTEIDRMSIAATTDGAGFYELEKGYPMGSWMVLEAYSDLYRTTGVTYQTLNMKEEVTILDAIVDIGLLPILGQPVRLDWGVVPYGPNENGGIAGTVFYDTIRAEDEASYSLNEPWGPGIPDLTMNLYAAVVDDYGQLVLDPANNGAAIKGPLLATTTTETFERPKGCQPLDVNGDPVYFPSLPLAEAYKDCLEGPLMGTQIGDGQNNLDGNWGFSTRWVIDENGNYVYEADELGNLILDENGNPIHVEEPLPPGHYLVEVVIPDDASGNPMFQVTREEDLNMFDGDEFTPEITPPACAGPLHTVNLAEANSEGYPETTILKEYSIDGVITTVEIPVPASTPVSNPGYWEDGGGSRYEGQVKPLCTVKHAYLQNGRAVAPIFTLFTEVPIPGKWKGYIIDNLNVSVDPNTLFFGEMAGVPEVPIGLYDYSGRLVHTVHSDFNGVYEVLMPSTGTFNAPTPSGMLANVYYQYGNDPGPVGAPNERYNPQFRSIGTSFEIYPGTIVPADLAPQQNGAAIWAPGSQFFNLNQCRVEDTRPQLFAVSQPYGSAGSSFTISGAGFGLEVGSVTLGGVPLTVNSWSEAELNVSVPVDFAAGPQQLLITAANGMATINGLTYHVLGDGYNPNVYEVGPGRAFDPVNYDGTASGPIQAAIDAAYLAGGQALVVVYPGLQVDMWNTPGMYLENPVVYSPVKLQGVGPGGGNVPGSIIDGRAVGGDSPYSEWWREDFMMNVWNNRGGWDRGLVDGDGNPRLYEGAVISVFGEASEFTDGFNASIDGFSIQGGDQQGFPNNPMEMEGPPVAPINVLVQGGGIFVDGHAPYLQITNNIIQSNGGSYGGAIRLGTPHIPEPLASNHNENTVIAHNRILANGGTNLAGAIAVFNGTDNYEIANNDICGNSSVEYGGGISHYGFSPFGQIHHNRIYYNSAYDEGGGVMIAGELPAVPGELSEGSGPVDVFNNLIQSNLANDDGGGLRFLMAGAYLYDEDGNRVAPSEFNVYNNIITNNVSTHEGGGISLNDATFVNIFNNTIAKNITTATAMTSDGSPAPAGLSSSRNSWMLQGTLDEGAPIFSDPLLFNNIFWDNWAGYRFGTGISGIGIIGDPNPVNIWDLGVGDGSGALTGHFSNQMGMDPLFVDTYSTQVHVFPWRGNANFVGASIVALDLPGGSLPGDYHIASKESPAANWGVTGLNGVSAPSVDFDGDPRPGVDGFDVGADEFDQLDDYHLSFSSTSILDNFNRANGALGSNWSGSTNQGVYRINNQEVQVRSSGAVWWSAASFGVNQEAYFNFTQPHLTASEQGLLLKLNGGPPTNNNSSYIKVVYNATTSQVLIISREPRVSPVIQRILDGVSFAAGDVLGVRVEDAGYVIVYKNGALVGSTNVGIGSSPWAYSALGGFIGVNFNGPTSQNDARFDDFGGGSMP